MIGSGLTDEDSGFGLGGNRLLSSQMVQSIPVRDKRAMMAYARQFRGKNKKVGGSFATLG